MVKIAIASGKGGTGKTFFATNLYYSLLKNNFRAVLIDCDAEAPNAAAFFNTRLNSKTEVTQLIPVINNELCTFCGKCHEYCNYNAIFILPPMKIIKVIEDLCHGCGACSVACESDAISEKPVSLGQVNHFITGNNREIIEARTNIGVLSPVPVIKAAIKQAGLKDEIVILDSPPGTSCPFIQTVTPSDFVILVTEPTPFGLSDLKQSIDTLRIINKPFGVVINRSGSGNNDVHKYLSRENIPLLLEIPFKRETAEICLSGGLVTEKDDFFSRQLLSVAENINTLYGNSDNQR